MNFYLCILYYVIKNKTFLSAGELLFDDKCQEWEEEIFFPKGRDPEDEVVNTVVRKTAFDES